ncbi:MAG: aspartyl/asparaginyl beta-hydroxylase domain-containing protein [Betaproteobacteria bacterium]|nr:aspartyl/asparaginyl beta-hydroxylase domain-containing protein [Betaproteobacteria bacterium]
MQNSPSRSQEIAALEAQAARAVQAGRESEASSAWERIVALDPGHLPAWRAIGQRAYRLGDMQGARAAVRRVAEADGADPQQWVSVALACKGLKDEAGEQEAIQRALKIDPMDLLALIMRANLLERQGKVHEAAIAFRAVTAVSPPMDRLHPDLRSSVAYAMASRDEYDRRFGQFLDRYLDAHYRSHAGEDLRRFRDSVDLVVGRKRRYDSLPSHYFVPRLPPIEFFERGDFPWLDAFEAATDSIRQEFLAVLEDEAGFSPYIAYPEGLPLNQWAELNHSPRWSAYRLIEKGVPVEGNAGRCPVTMGLLAGAPQPDQPGRTPAAMFSLLKPRTRIPPHTGVTNARLVVHLPLIVPEGCGFRVGNETRQWVPGKAWVFDDTLEHEAWNDSDKLRVVLIFDIWHPYLTAAERALITAMAAGMNEFTGGTGGYEL